VVAVTNQGGFNQRTEVADTGSNRENKTMTIGKVLTGLACMITILIVLPAGVASAGELQRIGNEQCIAQGMNTDPVIKAHGVACQKSASALGFEHAVYFPDRERDIAANPCPGDQEIAYACFGFNAN
jgi:hypothetical protein